MLAFEHVSDFTAMIIDTKIIGNTAISSGAGIFISFYDSSINNRIIIKNSTFEGNLCDQDGGAISVNTFEVANDNALIVEDSSFDGNKAMVGGGACSVNIQVHNPRIMPSLILGTVKVMCNLYAYRIIWYQKKQS